VAGIVSLLAALRGVLRVLLMLAAGRIGKEPEKYGFVDLEYHPPLTFETVEVSGGTRLAVVACAIRVDIGDVEELNPQCASPGRTLVSAYTPRPQTTHIPARRQATVASPVR
jgi:hypothetical protein